MLFVIYIELELNGRLWLS